MSVVSSPAAAISTPNPLLIGSGLPPFEAIKPSHVVPGIDQLLKTLGQALAALENTLEAPLAETGNGLISWETLVTPLTAITERLGWSWGIVGHLMGVKNSPELRTAYESVQPSLVQFSTQISQSHIIFKAL